MPRRRIFIPPLRLPPRRGLCDSGSVMSNHALKRGSRPLCRVGSFDPVGPTAAVCESDWLDEQQADEIAARRNAEWNDHMGGV